MPRRNEGSVKQKNDGLWYGRVRWTDETDNKIHDKKFAGQKSEPDAYKLVIAFKNKLEKKGTKAVKSEKMTFGQFADRFEKVYLVAPEYRDGKKVKGVHLRGTKSKMTAFRDYFGDKRLSSIRYSDIESFKNLRLKTPVTRSGKEREIATVNRELSLLRRIFTLAKRDELIDTHPFEGGGLVSAKFETSRERTLAKSEELRLFDACGKRVITYKRYGKEITARDNGECREHLKPFLICALDTAMRAGEISKLEWRDIDLETGIITIRAETCKTGKSRRIPILTERLKNALLHIYEKFSHNLNDLVFGMNSIRKAFGNACQTAEIKDFRIHDCRHTAITRWIDSGMNPAKAMKYSGHTVMATFMRYLNLKDEEMQRDAAAFKLYEENRVPISEPDGSYSDSSYIEISSYAN